MILSDRHRARNIIILILSVILLCSCTQKDEKFSDSRIAMGTSVSITVYDKDDKAFVDGVFSLLYDIEKKISAKLDSSYISEINRNAGIMPVSVPDDVYSLVEYSLWISEKTEGLFNPAIGALSSIWGIGSDSAKIPSQDEINQVLPLLSTDDIVLDSENKTVYLKKKGMKLDLGGIGKGYAADSVRDYLVSNGVERAIVNLGGNIYALGRKNNEEKWKVGIMDPNASGKYVTLVEVEDKSVVTSGGYERFFEKDGVVYHHILNSETGFPFESNLLSATIVTDNSTLADALSTTVFAGGKEIAEEISERFGVAVIIYTEDKEIITYGNP